MARAGVNHHHHHLLLLKKTMSSLANALRVVSDAVASKSEGTGRIKILK